MHRYSIHNLETAPEASRNALQTLKQVFGFVPNLAATMAESPTLVNGLVGALVNLRAGTFTDSERQALLLTNAVANRCSWAIAFHSTLAKKEGIAASDVEAIRNGRAPKEARVAALSAISRALIETRGHLGDREQRSRSIARSQSAEI